LAFDNELADTIRITVIATGFSGERKSDRQKKFKYKSEEKIQEEKNIIMDDLKKPAFKRWKTSKLK
jgi:cell division GTPase FtsZ